MKFHHVGIACRDIHEQIASISKLHEVKEQSEIVFDPEQQAELVMLTLADGTNLELIAGKQVENLVKKISAIITYVLRLMILMLK